MKMKCSTKTFKYFLLVAELLCAILGVTLICLGISLLNSIEDVKVSHGEDLAAIVIIVLGFVILLNSIFGTVSMILESHRMLASSAVILFLLMAIQIVLMTISYSASVDELPAGLEKGFDELWDRAEHQNSSLAIYEEWLECCGKNSAQDYFVLDKLLPKSCCKEQDCTQVLNVFVDGCEKKFRDYASAKTKSFNCLSWLLIGTELLTSILACVIVDRWRSFRDRIRFYNTSFD